MTAGGLRRGSRSNDWTVGPFWRLLGAALAGALAFSFLTSASAYNALYRLDARLIDLWQRLSPLDEPSGEVIVVGVDSASIREKGRWPWSRSDLAELVEIIAEARPRSLTLDILLTEPGPYAPVNLMRTFRQNGPEVIASLPRDPDLRLAEALASAPTALGVAGASRRAIDELPRLTQCADPDLLTPDLRRPYHVECLLFPLPQFEEQASSYAVTFSEQDLDGIVRRGRAFVAQPYRGEDGQTEEAIFTALPLAALTTCAAVNPDCFWFDPEMTFLTEEVDRFSGFRLPLKRIAGTSPPPAPMTESFGLWLDFGALPALGPHFSDGPPGVAATISAASLFQGDLNEVARIEGKHVILGLTRLGAIDQHTTPLAFETGVPGVMIQALAADNLVAGRILREPNWGGYAVAVFGALIAFLALARYFVASVTALIAVAAFLIALPIGVSWAAFEFGQTVIFGATPALAAFLGGAPVVYGRMSAIRRELLSARENEAREEERMDAARRIQLGSLPFDADFAELGFETASICRPAHEVGGDFFELFELRDGRLFAAVGDVSGKGLEASLVTALSKSISGAVTDRVDGPLGEALGEVSREFIRQAPTAWRRQKGGFVTLVAARIDPRTGEAEFACAGCEPPTVVRNGGRIDPIELPSVAPLGWIEDARFETARMTLAPGDTVTMFTDGVTEAETPAGDLFGQERADAIAASTASGGARALLEALETAVLAHQAGGEPTDDTTILTVTYRGA